MDTCFSAKLQKYTAETGEKVKELQEEKKNIHESLNQHFRYYPTRLSVTYLQKPELSFRASAKFVHY